MGRSAKSSRRNDDDDAVTPWFRRACQFILFGCLIAAAALGYRLMRDRVEKAFLSSTVPPRITLKNKPAWMSPLLADDILRTIQPKVASSPLDHDLLVSITQTLAKNPWVQKVNQVRRAYQDAPGDTLEIDCEFRAPIALVKWPSNPSATAGVYYWLVDQNGYLLPEHYTADKVPLIQYGGANDHKHVEIRVIEGVKAPPPEVGKRWNDEGLIAGVDVAKLLYGKEYTDEIVRINVIDQSARGGSSDPRITLITRYNTKVIWGEAPNVKFNVEYSPAEKLTVMKLVYEQRGRVDNNHPVFDIRFEKLAGYTREGAQGDIRD